MADRLRRKTQPAELTHEDYAALISEKYRIEDRKPGWFTAGELGVLMGITNVPRWIATHAPDDFEHGTARINGRVRDVWRMVR